MGKRPETGNTRGRAVMRSINLIERDGSQSEDSGEQDEQDILLHVSGSGIQPFVMKGKIKNQRFTTMFGSGSPITIFTQADLRELLKVDVICARLLPKREQYVDYNN